jgi:hypothetical protein
MNITELLLTLNLMVLSFCLISSWYTQSLKNKVYDLKDIIGDERYLNKCLKKDLEQCKYKLNEVMAENQSYIKVLTLKGDK